MTAQGSSAHVSSGNVLFTLLGFMGMYLLLGLLYVVMVIFDGLRGPQPPQTEDIHQAEGLTDSGIY
jgi:cytochrome d ubiquinol oxidase subunit I